MNFIAYDNCLNEINSFGGRGINRGLDRISKALERLKNPQKNYPSIHIAGTNGKGSTTAILSHLLKDQGYRVGSTYSPHLSDLRERIQINNEWISQEEFINLHQRLKSNCDDLQLTYYEWVIAMAFLYFSEQKVDFAVLETGMGGRWDASNLCDSIISAVTNVSLDHQTILGNTEAEICEEKIQIIKKDHIAWIGLSQKDLIQKTKNHARQCGAQLRHLDDFYEDLHGPNFQCRGTEVMQVNLLGDHQKRNAGLAVMMALSLKEKSFSIDENKFQSSLKHIKWPGRLELLSETPYVLIDSAHNIAGAQVLADFLKQSSKKFKLIFTCLKDRPFMEILEILLPYVSEVYLFDLASDRSYSYSELETFKKNISLPVSLIKNKPEEWKKFMDSLSPQDSLLITGSLYLIAEARPYFRKG